MMSSSTHQTNNSQTEGTLRETERTETTRMATTRTPLNLEMMEPNKVSVALTIRFHSFVVHVKCITSFTFSQYCHRWLDRAA